LNAEVQGPNPSQIQDDTAANQLAENYTARKRFFRDIVETILIAFVLFIAVNTISARIRVESISMEPTLFRGDFILVEKISQSLRNPNRGDIVVFKYPSDPTQNYIKRVIGLPGDRIFITNGKLMINGDVIDEPYIKAMPAYTGNWEVPEDSIFVLGDNRNRSNDSHIWGMVPYDNILGRALLIYWPLSRGGFLGDRLRK
jgi:signal peptidase I